MSVQRRVGITGTSTITAVGHDSEAVVMAIRSNDANLEEYDAFYDVCQNPVIAARIEGVSDEIESIPFMTDVIRACFDSLLNRFFNNKAVRVKDVYLITGAASENRPGPRYALDDETLQHEFTEALNKRGFKVQTEHVACGNPSGFYGIVKALEILTNKPDAVCILGCADSLLDGETLEWFERDERLKSVTAGRNHGFSPSQAAGFMVIESEDSALQNKRKVIAWIKGVSTTNEPAPFLSEAPSRGVGLTKAVTSALSESGYLPESIDSVLCDLNGEFYRSREWGYVENRVFGECNTAPHLIHPADCMGSIGAASGAVLVNIAATELASGELGENVLVFCSDDEAYRGAVVLSRYDESQTS